MKELMSERIKEERIMKKNIKTIMRNTKLVMILAFLPALLSAGRRKPWTIRVRIKKLSMSNRVNTWSIK